MFKHSIRGRRLRGSFTPAVAILMVFLIVVASLVIDYSRFNSAQSFAANQLSNAVDIALLDYYAPLQEEYDLYALNDSSKAQDTVLNYLYKAFSDSGHRQFYRVEVDKLKLSFRGEGLSDKAVLRQMIVENHSKAFVANGLTMWIERLEVLKGIDQLIGVVAQFNDIVKRLAELEGSYRKLKVVHQTFVDWYDYVRKFDGEKIAQKIASLELDLLVADSDIAEFKASLPQLEPEQDMLMSDRIELLKLTSVRDKVINRIDDCKLAIRRFIDGADSINQLIANTVNFSQQVDALCENIDGLLNSLTNDSIELRNQNVGSVVSGIKDYATQLLDNLQAANKKIAKKLKGYQSFSAEVAQYKAVLSTLLDSSQLSAESYRNLLQFDGELAFTTIQILMRNSDDSGKSGFQVVLEKLYQFSEKVVARQFGYDLGEIPPEVYSKLPSRPVVKANRGGSGSFSKVMIDKQRAMHDQMNRSTDLLKTLTSGILGKAESGIEKMIIADYVMTHFSHNYAVSETKIANNRYLRDSEVEYILQGNAKGAYNALMTEATIYSMRLALNAMSILAFKQTELNAVTTEIAALTGGLSYPIVYGLCTVGWSGIESAIDLHHLKKREKVIFFKLAGDINFDMSLENLMNFDDAAQFDQTVDEFNPLAFDYGDHLFLLLLIQSEDKTLTRIMDAVSLSDQLQDISWCDLKTDFDISLSYRIKSWYGDIKGVLEGRRLRQNNRQIILQRSY